ncbi:YggT family protein [Nicoliella lavandulae]|uniref:YggT family protein n=1 Tax=Nicoliella lavandulae TaxID=3082954 RepID=A0ABU8SLK8_9LACO
MMLTLIGLFFFMINKLISLYMILILVYCLMSWLPNAAYSKPGQIIARLVQPALNLFSFARIGMISLAPVAVIIVLDILQVVLTRIEIFVVNAL